MAAQLGDHQPGFLHQRVRLAELRRAAVGQPIATAALAALAGHPVRIGEGQQRGQRVLLIEFSSRRRRGSAQQAAKLPGQLPDALHPSTTTILQLMQAQGEIGSAAARPAGLNITLDQQRRHVGSQGSHAQRLPAQQHVRQARMHRQLGHRLAVTGQLPAAVLAALQRTEALQQGLRLTVGGGRRTIEPGQLVGLDAPAR